MFFLLLTLLFGTMFASWLLRKQPAGVVVGLDPVKVIVPGRGCGRGPMLTADRRSSLDYLVIRGHCLEVGRIDPERSFSFVPIALRCVKELLRAHILFRFYLSRRLFSCPSFPGHGVVIRRF